MFLDPFLQQSQEVVAPTALALKEGNKVFGWRFILQRHLGQGGMGQVWRVCLLLALVLTQTLNSNAFDAPAITPLIPSNAMSVSAFAPKGWKIESKIEADLNRDERLDVALVITQKSKRPDNPEFERTRRVLVLALRQEDGSLKRSAVSDRGVMDSDEGGVLGDPFVGLKVERGVVVIEHYGGSRNRWGITTRYRLQEGRWMLIGRTQADSDTLNPDFLDKVDHNLSTGLVIRNFAAGGINADELSESQRRMQKHPEARYWQLPAAFIRKAPALDGKAATSDWGTHVLVLNRKEQVSTNAALWKGLADLSATLRAVSTCDSLFMRVEVTDDQSAPKDHVRLTNLRGAEIQPGTTKRTATTTGYVMELSWTKAQLRSALGDDSPFWFDPDSSASDEVVMMEELPVVIEIQDVDDGQPRAILSTRPAGASHAAGVLIGDPAELVLKDR